MRLGATHPGPTRQCPGQGILCQACAALREHAPASAVVASDSPVSCHGACSAVPIWVQSTPHWTGHPPSRRPARSFHVEPHERVLPPPAAQAPLASTQAPPEEWPVRQTLLGLPGRLCRGQIALRDRQPLALLAHLQVVLLIIAEIFQHGACNLCRWQHRLPAVIRKFSILPQIAV